MTIFARNPDNGEAKWAYQMTPHDEWDYDGVNENVLVDLTIGAKPVKALVHFDRNGFGYTLDRTNGKVLVAEPFGPVNWASKIDLSTGLPVRNAQYGTTSKKKDRKSTRLNSSHSQISYAVFCLKKKKKNKHS